jgi:hypothetical protein
MVEITTSLPYERVLQALTSTGKKVNAAKIDGKVVHLASGNAV